MLDGAGGATALERAVFFLQDKLQEASLLEGRPAAIDALLAVAEFLSVISGPGERLHQRPVNKLISALMSLDDGKVLPLLAPVRRSGSSVNSVGMASVKATAVFAVERLLAAGLDANEAYESVALACRRAGIRPGRKGARYQTAEMTARTVRGWCAEVSADVGCHTRAGRHLFMLRGGPPSAQSPDELMKRLRCYLDTQKYT